MTGPDGAQLVGKAPLCAQGDLEQAVIAVCRPDDRRARAIAKQRGHSATPVVKLQPRGVNLGPHQQYVLRTAAADVEVSHRQSINETSALVADIHGRYSHHAQALLQQGRVAGKINVGAQGGAQQQVDVRDLESGLLQGLERSPFGQRQAALAVVHVAPLTNARAFFDPLVTGIHHLGEIIVAYDRARHLKSGAQDTTGRLVPFRSAHAFTTAAPQDAPEPAVSRASDCPGWSCPSASRSASAMGSAALRV